MQLVEQAVMQRLPHPDHLPVAQPSSAGDAMGEAKTLGEGPAMDALLEDGGAPGERGTWAGILPAACAPGNGGAKWRGRGPEVGEAKGFDHLVALQLSHEARFEENFWFLGG